MKYGESLQRTSVPGWSLHNVDYRDIKVFIKEHTTPGAGKSISIPGHVDAKALDLDDELFAILDDQHSRIDLFVRSKAGEIQRRLDHSHQQLRALASRRVAEGQRINLSRTQKYSKLENDVVKAGEEIKSLARFTAAQRTGFRKLLKKYKKWSGSTRVEERFRDEILSNPKSFTKLDLGPMLDEYSKLRPAIRAMYDGSVRWSASPAPSSPIRDVSPASRPSNTTISKLQDAIASDSKIMFDTAIATVPLGEEGTFASFFVDPENIVELQVFLLQHAEYFGHRSRSNSVVTPISATPSRNGSVSGNTRADFHMIVADSIDRFVKEQSALTVDDREHRVGSYPQRTKACVRWNEEEDAMACLRLKSGKAKSAALKRKHARAFFDRKALFSAKQSAAVEESDEEVNNVRQEFVKDNNVQPLFHFSSCRSRLTGINSGAPTLSMATLDTNIVMESVEAEGEAKKKINFPYALLLVRQEGGHPSALLAALDNCHLVERVRGFSLELHAVWAVHQPKNMPPPFWLPILDRDIRKLPPPALPRQHSFAGSGSGSGSTAASRSGPESRGSFAAITDSTTAVDTAVDSLIIDTSIPIRSSRKKRRGVHLSVAHEEQHQQQPAPQRYWNEFDDPEDGNPDDANAYVIYIDPNAPSRMERLFDSCFDRVASFFGMKPERADAGPASPGNGDEDPTSSDDDEDEESGLLHPSSRRPERKNNSSTWGTFSSSATATSSNSTSTRHTGATTTTTITGSSPALLALRSQRAAYYANLVPRFAAACLAAAYGMLLMAYVLAFTGRHKYAHAVDAAVITAGISSVAFAVVGFSSVLREGATAISLPAWALCVVALVGDALGAGGLVAWMARAG